MRRSLREFSRRRPAVPVLAVLSLVWLFAAFASLWNDSATMDEAPHLACGLAVLEYGDFRFNPEHPPLLKVLGALPVYLFARPDMRVHFEGGDWLRPWLDSLQYEYGHYLLFRAGGDVRSRLRWMRVAPVLLGLLGGWLAFYWGREVGRSDWAGLFSAGLLLLYPEYIGHARYLTLDVPMAVACGGISVAAWRWWKRPSVGRAAVFCAAAAIGSQIKLPVTVFVLIQLVTLAGLNGLARRVRWYPLTGLILAVIASVYFATWAGAGFRFAYVPEDYRMTQAPPYVPPLAGESDGLKETFIDFAWRHRLLPETALATLIHTGSFGARTTMLLGERRMGGWFTYYFYTTLFKTPLLMLLLACALCIEGLSGLSRRRRSATFRWRLSRAFLLWAPFVIVLVLTIWARASIGHRHILFFYFPVCVSLGAGLDRWIRNGGARRGFAVLVLAGQVASFVLVFPHYATYANILTRTPYRLSSIVVDSNVDWGQDVARLGDWVNERGIEEINYAVFGVNRPESFGIDSYRPILWRYPFWIGIPAYEPPDPALPTAVSLNALGAVRAAFPRLYDREPDVLLNSIVIFFPL